MRILITGGCGFIGSHLAQYHLDNQDEVLLVDDLSTGSLSNIQAFSKHTNLQFEQADVVTWKNLPTAVKWADRVYHMAAVVGVFRVLAEPLAVIHTNVLSCERLLQAMVDEQVSPRVIIASTSSVYGKSQKLLQEKGELVISTQDHLASYAVSKMASEVLALAYTKQFSLPISTVRFFNVIGPRQTGGYGMVVPRFVKQACQGQPLTIYGDGSQQRVFCDVRDVVRGLDLLANNPAAIGEIVNLGHNEEISILELAELIRRKAKSQSEIQFLPYREAYGVDLQDIKFRHPDLTRFIELTNFEYQWTLEQTIDALIKEHQLLGASSF